MTPARSQKPVMEGIRAPASNDGERTRPSDGRKNIKRSGIRRGMRISRCMSPAVLFCALLTIFCLPKGHGKSWAEHWCEVNDCKGEKAALVNADQIDSQEKEVRIATRRFHATGEVRAIKGEHVKAAMWQYDGPTLDHPAFPGVAQEHAVKAEKKFEEGAIAARKQAAKRAALGAEFKPGGGYLPPAHHDAQALVAVEEEHPAVEHAKHKFRHMAEEARIPCQYDIASGQAGKLSEFTTFPQSPDGCAAGSVWMPGKDGKMVNDANNLLHRTAEHKASQWRKTNGTHREWFEDVYQLPQGQYGPESKKQIEAKKLLPYKYGAPPPCAPGYGGAACKRELGAGADYVDEEESVPPWANKESVAQLQKFWKKTLTEHARIAGAPTNIDQIAGGAYKQMMKKKKKKAAKQIAGGGGEEEDAKKEGEAKGVGGGGGKNETAGEGEGQEEEDKECRVTGVEKIEWEIPVEGETAMEIVGGEDDWEPNPRASAHGPWYGGWWVGVYGKNFGEKTAELREIQIGGVRCRREVWLSETSAACMVPKGMGLEQSVTVETKNGGTGQLEGKFTYDPPEVLSYHPRNGAVRGGTLVTISGRNFGHIDTSPTAYLAGRICVESFWVNDNTVLCRSPPGVGGTSHLHHVDVSFQHALHVQDMPRRLKRIARGIQQELRETIKAQPDAVFEIDTTAHNKKDTASKGGDVNPPTGTDLAKAKAAGESAIAEARKAGGKSEDVERALLQEKKAEWDKREVELMQKRGQAELEREAESRGKMVEYLQTSVERDVQRWERQKKIREAARREKEAKEAALARQRAEEEAALHAKAAQIAAEKEAEEEKTKKSLEKFKLAQERARQTKAKKLMGRAQQSGAEADAREALLAAKDAGVEGAEVQKLREILGLKEGEWPKKSQDPPKTERKGGKADPKTEKPAAEKKQPGSGAEDTASEDPAEEVDDGDLPDLDIYEEGEQEGKGKKKKKAKKKKGKAKGKSEL